MAMTFKSLFKAADLIVNQKLTRSSYSMVEAAETGETVMEVVLSETVMEVVAGETVIVVATGEMATEVVTGGTVTVVVAGKIVISAVILAVLAVLEALGA